MLDIIFYTEQAEQLPTYVELSESLYEWLAKSPFSKIGSSRPVQLNVEGEVLEIPVVTLGQSIRQQLSQCFRDQIVAETEVVLEDLETVELKEDYRSLTYRLRKFQELRKCVENPNLSYLQRV